MVKLVDIDQKTGKFKLTCRVLLPKPEGYEERPPRPERRPQTEKRRQGIKEVLFVYNICTGILPKKWGSGIFMLEIHGTIYHQ